jgi:hypothetical protein
MLNIHVNAAYLSPGANTNDIPPRSFYSGEKKRWQSPKFIRRPQYRDIQAITKATQAAVETCKPLYIDLQATVEENKDFTFVGLMILSFLINLTKHLKVYQIINKSRAILL